MNLIIENCRIKLAYPLEILGKHNPCLSFLNDRFLFLTIKSCKSSKREVLPHKKLFFLLTLLLGMVSAFSLNAAPRPSLKNGSQTNSYFIKHLDLINPVINTAEIQASPKKEKIISSFHYRKKHIAHRIRITLRRGRGIKINNPVVENVSQHLFIKPLISINALSYKKYVEHKIWVPPE